jgi:hypothetical protein
LIGRSADKMRIEKELAQINKTFEMNLERLVVVKVLILYWYNDRFQLLVERKFQKQLLALLRTTSAVNPMLERIAGFDYASKNYS